MPLESIVPASQVSSQPSVPLPSTAAGAKPSGLPNAPAIPSLSSWNPSKYPTSDKPPPTNSPEVVEWIDQVRNSGVVIPNIAPFAAGDGMCAIPANAGRVGNATECWWTCGHCERKTDIVNCKQRMTWGSSFDDGPAPDTPRLLQYLEREKLKTTFFVVGSRVKDRPNMVQTAYALGHTVGVHTWSHTSLTTQTTEAIIAELGWSKQIVKDATGVTPYYFRPPYGDIDDRVRAIAYAMDLVPVIWTVAGGQSYDTFDWEVPGGMKTAVDSVNQFLTILSHASALPTGFIVLEHDLWWEQVELAVGYFLPSARAEKFTVTSINACNNQPLAGMYVETAGATRSCLRAPAMDRT
ncbi:glycoside hydrolase/deacetylase [Auriculariales sp. MPI-PUGE-AT-0066]|nr:glycoside hydrolase/deacetylase [Auriculariales sp. MPI-PUGE-AT-0066]